MSLSDEEQRIADYQEKQKELRRAWERMGWKVESSSSHEEKGSKRKPSWSTRKQRGLWARIRDWLSGLLQKKRSEGSYVVLQSPVASLPGKHLKLVWSGSDEDRFVQWLKENYPLVEPKVIRLGSFWCYFEGIVDGRPIRVSGHRSEVIAHLELLLSAQ